VVRRLDDGVAACQYMRRQMTNDAQTLTLFQSLSASTHLTEELHLSSSCDDRASRSGQPSPDGSLEVLEREDSVGLLSPPSSDRVLGHLSLAHETAVRPRVPRTNQWRFPLLLSFVG
jgi:hypothetical protein